MRALCIHNSLATIAEAQVRERLRRSIHIDGPITDLVVGREYAIQAIEERDDGLSLYLHTVPMNDYPYPYPVEMFQLRENSVPAGWGVYLRTHQGRVVCKRISFSLWATDDRFYERLVEGDAETTSIYRGHMDSI